ncbi:HIT domain-containing protein [Wolbachia endosymbiont of Spodoptera picta]|uniref:HIT domain-containing protein n=1 Tax=Wolbachia endosymbiont of Spodoptera picta TaxID=2769078 RepID=UPI001BA6EAD3|nr:HIT domain-containing protein [Wolbachia endosymbiont of Spodoptera picta]QUI60152.1 HIT domain-containing protein [Wolbachia endosymbiont of Spodoptera picta]
MGSTAYDDTNIFAKILRGELSYEEIHKNENVLAFRDKYPDAPVYILVIPKAQYVSYDDFVLKASEEEIVSFFKTVREIAHKYNLEKTGYRLVTNHGKDGEQVIPHFHIHILGGKRLGKHVNS